MVNKHCFSPSIALVTPGNTFAEKDCQLLSYFFFFFVTFEKFKCLSPTLKKIDIKYFSKIGTLESKTITVSIFDTTKLMCFFYN